MSVKNKSLHSTYSLVDRRDERTGGMKRRIFHSGNPSMNLKVKRRERKREYLIGTSGKTV